MRNARKHVRNALYKGVLFIRDPQHDFQFLAVSDLDGAVKQLSNLVGRSGQQRFGKPHAILSHFANDIERLMPLLPLQPVDCQYDLFGIAIKRVASSCGS